MSHDIAETRREILAEALHAIEAIGGEGRVLEGVNEAACAVRSLLPDNNVTELRRGAW